MLLAVLFALVLQNSGAAAADHGRVSVALNAHDVDVEFVTLVIEKSGSDDAPLEKVLRLGSPLSIELREGSWRLDLANSPLLWHAGQDFFVSPAGTTQLVVDVWPRSTVVGKIVTKTAAAPREIRARFEPASVLAAGTVPSGEVRCPIEHAVFRCDLPAGEFHLRLRPPGYIAHYVSGLSLSPGSRKDLGTIAFREGQSITGRVQIPKELDGDLTAVTVTAEPLLGTRGPAGEKILAITAKPAKSGFFHLDGVAPGAYAVRAAYRRDLYSELVEVEVRPAREAELVDPLRLYHARQIRFILSPPLSPARKPWHVRLARESGVRTLDPVAQSNASAEGRWQSPRLQPDRYMLTVGTMGGDVWHEEEIDLADGDLDTQIAMAGTHDLHGTLTLGGDPLQASLTFSQPSGLQITTSSDESGRFVVVVPKAKAGTLDVRIDSEAPTVQRRVRVDVPANGESIEIALPKASLTGEVVDSAGAPVADAIVSITNGDPFDGLVQPESDDRGRFDVHGLAPGNYSLMAAAFMRESESIAIEVEEDEAAGPIRLVLDDANTLRGRVVSSHGGVPGARVHAHAVDVHQMMAVMPPSNANGEFVVPVPRGARLFDLTVAAAGFSCLVRRVKAGDRPLNVEVEQNGGTLTVLAGGNDVPQIIHDGGTVPVTILSYLWPVQTEVLADGSRQFVLPMMDPGSYSACSVEQLVAFRNSAGQAGGRCVHGSLAAFGALTLDVRAKERP